MDCSNHCYFNMDLLWYRLRKDEKLREPLGQLIDINENNISIYVEGSGSKTLVFLSGSGTCSPILDFKSLYSLLSDEYRIIVVEKFGYGYSDVVDEDRNIQTVLSETRLALNKAGIDGPYVLCPHSMSGIEALYWAQEYENKSCTNETWTICSGFRNYQTNSYTCGK